ncbi:peptide ABC transporter substrate-binding protein [Paraglaciecola sp. L3A3]|uniref:peptide ABC transporter substrate-binding protein n=1 Tax=Paraglaciecola sp. L3A3 TaxID=2686358 RepID=UPI0018EF1EA0|nr:peptide ABC transporter substrate-binding protein [Paraglaciecola sp. L3A3]
MKTLLAIPLFITAMFALTACGGGSDSNSTSEQTQDTADSSAPKTLTIGMSQYPSTMHPNIESMMAKSYVRGFLARSMTYFDADWNLVCGLCVTLPTFENGLAVLEKTPDGKPGIAVTYELPAGVTWGDGTSLTTADIAFAWEVGQNSQTGANNLEMYTRGYQLDIIDQRKFTLHLNKVTFDYNQLGDLYPLPKHLEGELFAEEAYEYRHRTNYNANTTLPGLWWGPYIITDSQQGSSITMERNPHWYGKTPYFDRIIVRAILNTSAMEANLRSGTIDMVAGELGVTLDQALAFEKRHGDKYNIIYKPGLFYEHIDLNLENPILKDKSVRQALMYSIDRQMISELLFQGRQPVAHSNISSLDRVASSNVKIYSLDLAKAAALYDAAGWSVMKDGIRHNEAGEPLRLEIMSTAGNKTREKVEQVLQSQLKQVGVDLRIRNEQARVFFGQTTRERKFSAMAMYAWISSPENVPRSTLHSSEIPTAENNYAGQNYTTISLPELDQVLEAIETELDADKRLPLWEKMQQIYTEEIPVMPLYYRANSFILPKWLKGLRPTGHLNPSSDHAEYWHKEDGSGQ